MVGSAGILMYLVFTGIELFKEITQDIIISPIVPAIDKQVVSSATIFEFL